jgi:hypothetical protein
MKHFSAEEKQNSGGNTICQTLCRGETSTTLLRMSVHSHAGDNSITNLTAGEHTNSPLINSAGKLSWGKHLPGTQRGISTGEIFAGNTPTGEICKHRPAGDKQSLDLLGKEGTIHRHLYRGT